MHTSCVSANARDVLLLPEVPDHPSAQPSSSAARARRPQLYLRHLLIGRLLNLHRSSLRLSASQGMAKVVLRWQPAKRCWGQPPQSVGHRACSDSVAKCDARIRRKRL
jgi:hypothetical protein